MAKLSKRVTEALDDAGLPGSWEYREGLIYIGIEGNFNGYPLTKELVRDRLDVYLTLASHFDNH